MSARDSFLAHFLCCILHLSSRANMPAGVGPPKPHCGAWAATVSWFQICCSRGPSNLVLKACAVKKVVRTLRTMWTDTERLFSSRGQSGQGYMPTAKQVRCFAIPSVFRAWLTPDGDRSEIIDNSLLSGVGRWLLGVSFLFCNLHTTLNFITLLLYARLCTRVDGHPDTFIWTCGKINTDVVPYWPLYKFQAPRL